MMEILPVSWHWGRQGTRHDSWFKRIMVGRDWSSLSLLDIRSSLSTCFTLYYSFLMLIYYHAHNSLECNQTCACQPRTYPSKVKSKLGPIIQTIVLSAAVYHHTYGVFMMNRFRWIIILRRHFFVFILIHYNRQVCKMCRFMIIWSQICKFRNFLVWPVSCVRDQGGRQGMVTGGSAQIHISSWGNSASLGC